MPACWRDERKCPSLQKKKKEGRKKKLSSLRDQDGCCPSSISHCNKNRLCGKSMLCFKQWAVLKLFLHGYYSVRKTFLSAWFSGWGQNFEKHMQNNNCFRSQFLETFVSACKIVSSPMVFAGLQAFRIALSKVRNWPQDSRGAVWFLRVSENSSVVHDIWQRIQTTSRPLFCFSVMLRKSLKLWSWYLEATGTDCFHKISSFRLSRCRQFLPGRKWRCSDTSTKCLER